MYLTLSIQIHSSVYVVPLTVGSKGSVVIPRTAHAAVSSFICFQQLWSRHTRVCLHNTRQRRRETSKPTPNGQSWLEETRHLKVPLHIPEPLCRNMHGSARLHCARKRSHGLLLSGPLKFPEDFCRTVDLMQWCYKLQYILLLSTFVFCFCMQPKRSSHRFRKPMALLHRIET